MFNGFLGFSPERFANPLVIIGLALMIIGLALALTSALIAKALVKAQHKSFSAKGIDKQPKNYDWYIKGLGAIILITGALMAVLSI